MRDLLRYPITLAEIDACLTELARDIGAAGGIGDIRPLLLQAAAAIVRQTEGVTFEIGTPIFNGPNRDPSS